MPLYFLQLDAALFHQDLRPALATSWRERSFVPCRRLCDELRPRIEAFADRYHTRDQEPLLLRVAEGLPFDRDLWRLLAGEALLYAAAEIPEFETAADALTCLLAPDQYGRDDLSREETAPVVQAHFGSRDLTFGPRTYRPDHCGLNDTADVARLAAYLADVNPDDWSAAPLRRLPDVPEGECEEELAFAREWFPPLRDLYRRAHAGGQVVVCETL
jgi:hypothetical protein